MATGAAAMTTRERQRAVVLESSVNSTLFTFVRTNYKLKTQIDFHSIHFYLILKKNINDMTLFKNLYFPWSLENTEEQNHSVELLSANEQCKKQHL